MILNLPIVLPNLSPASLPDSLIALVRREDKNFYGCPELGMAFNIDFTS